MLTLLETAARPLLHEGPFDFGDATFVDTLRTRGLALATNRAEWRMPPAKTLFVQRKLAGTYLIAARLRARVDLRALVDRYLA